MAHGVETRLPFLDPNVVALALGMPTELLLRDGWTKWPLRKTLADLGGDGPAWRRGKRWFGVPQRAWLRGPLKPLVEAYAREPSAAWSSFANVPAARAFVHRWLDARHPNALFDDHVFTLISLDRFLRGWFPD